MKRKNGFTFVELLLVLSIVMVVSAVSYFSLRPYNDKRHLDTFMEQLEKDLLFAQMLAMSRQETVRVSFIDDGVYRVITATGEEIMLERHYDEDIIIFFWNTIMSKQVKFLDNGNIQVSGTVKITYKNQMYKLIFHLGKGRFHYE